MPCSSPRLRVGRPGRRLRGLDYQAYFAGEAVETGKAEGAYFEVGTGKFNADFENSLIGLTAGRRAAFGKSPR